MNLKVINPYTALGAKHKESLDYIIANLPLNPTFDDLNSKLTESFYTPDPDDPSLLDVAEEVIKTILPNVYNGYVNGGMSHKLQASSCKEIIERMLNGIHTVPVEAIADFLGNMEEEIVAGKLSYEEQVPLLIAVQAGKSDYEYWQAQIAIPGAWAPYLNTDNTINYLHVAGWVSAAMQGALLAYGLIRPPQVQFIDAYTALIGSTGLVAGKVVWVWVVRG